MNVVEIIFSPTGGTEKVARIISRQWTDRPRTIDLGNAKTDFSKCEIKEDDMVLIAMPSFGGLAPAPAVERLKQISGNGARAVLVCVYGNRAYDNTLVHMEDAAKASGFNVVAAVSAVAEHSIARMYATDRPDASDEKQLVEFAAKIAGKTSSVACLPGNRPYEKDPGPGMAPGPDETCAKCGTCAASCPVAAIDTNNFSADPAKCISCMRCVKVCPANARKLKAEVASMVATALKEVCSVRKENELFL